MEPLVIAHFNDIYEIEDQDTGKGAARFCTALQRAASNPMVLFSGDCFSPSHISELYRGADIVPVLRHLNVTCATIGNHDLDFGTQHLRSLIQQTGFPWVQSNLREAATSEPLGGAAETLVLSWKGWTVGLIGLAESEWLDIIGPCSSELRFEDFTASAKRHARALREAGCHVVIALTHMRVHNEIKLAQQCEEIDIILGGHDHLSKGEMHANCPVIKSGSDFEELTVVQVTTAPARFSGRHGLSFDWQKIRVTAEIPQDSAMEEIVQRFVGSLDKRSTVLATFKHALDCRFSFIRSEESEIGNLLTDLARERFKTDIVLLNAGHVRLNGFIPAGNFTERDLHALLPVRDTLARLQVSGSVLLKALNSSFEKFPALEGRFPMLSGARVEVDFSRSPRVVSVTVQGEPLAADRSYSVIATNYVATGNDGYGAFLDCPMEDLTDMMMLTCFNDFLTEGKAGSWTKVTSHGLSLNPKKDGRLHIIRQS